MPDLEDHPGLWDWICEYPYRAMDMPRECLVSACAYIEMMSPGNWGRKALEHWEKALSNPMNRNYECIRHSVACLAQAYGTDEWPEDAVELLEDAFNRGRWVGEEV